MIRPLFILSFTLLSLGCGPSKPLLRAQRFIAYGDYQRAERIFDNNLKTKGNDAEVIATQFKLLLAQDKVDKAAALYQRQPNRENLKAYAAATVWAAMRHQDPMIRRLAIHIARKADIKECEREMVKRLSDPDPITKTWAAVALSGHPAGAEALEQALDSSSDLARAIAVEEIAKIAGPKSYALLERMMDDKKLAVLRAIAKGFRYTKNKKAEKHLRTLLKKDNATLKYDVLKTVSALHLKSMRDRVNLEYKHPQLSIKRIVLETYYQLAPKKALPLLKAATKSHDIAIALFAAKLLYNEKESKPLYALIAWALLSKKETTRIAGIQAASTSSDRVTWQLAERGISDPTISVKLATLRMLFSKRHQIKKAKATTAHLLEKNCINAAIPNESCVYIAELNAKMKTPHTIRACQLLFQAVEKSASSTAKIALSASMHFCDSEEAGKIALKSKDIPLRLLAARHLYQKLR